METEVHEGTLLEALETLSQWSARITTEIPQVFLDWLPKGIALKTSSSPVRSAYLLCLLSCLREQSNTSEGAKKLIPTLTKVMDNSIKQSSQVAIVSEAAHAAACLVKVEMNSEENLTDFWKFILETNKQLFTNEKLLMAASPATLSSLCAVGERILLEKDPQESLQRPWLKVFVVAATANDFKTRKFAQTSLKRMVGTLGGDVLAALFLSELDQHLQSDQIKLGNAGSKDVNEVGNSTVSAKFVANALKAVAKGCKFAKENGEEAISLCKAFLNSCHEELVMTIDKSIWFTIAQTLKVNPAIFVERNCQSLVDDLCSTKLRPNCAVSLIKANANAMVPVLLSVFKERLSNKKLLISAESYAIYQTPKGELFDKQFLENLQNEGKSQNIKRESKAYSYKEQMEEIALRKELEEKRRREGKVVEPKLTPKQKEALNAQLEKEDNIRNDVQQLDESVKPVVNVMKIAVEQISKTFAKYISNLTKSLFEGFSSPICALSCIDIFVALRKSVFDNEDETLSQRIAWTIIQIQKPSCNMDHVMSKSGKFLKIRQNSNL